MNELHELKGYKHAMDQLVRRDFNVQFPLHRAEGEPVNVRIDGTFQKADLLRLFWSLVTCATDLDPEKETPRDVIQQVLERMK